MLAVVLRFANCNNGSNAGVSALNLNNSAGDANWNISASVIYHILQKAKIYPTPQTIETLLYPPLLRIGEWKLIRYRANYKAVVPIIRRR